MAVSVQGVPGDVKTGVAPAETRPLFISAAVLLGLAFAAALAGLLVEDVYTGPESTAAMFRGWDLVTVLVVAPALAVGVLSLHRPSRTPTLAVTSLAAYLAYSYAYYLFGTGFNDLFLVHIAVFVAASVTIALGLRALPVTGAPPLRLARPRARLAALLLGALTVGLTGMWVVAGIDNAVSGAVPAGSRLVETETVVRLGIVMDLAVLAPFYATAALLLWRGTVWGFLLSTVAVSSGLLLQLGYVVAMPVQVAADVPGAVRGDPAEPVIVLVYLFAALLLARARRMPPAPTGVRS
ncbi:MAG TPA: hypothetical protein VHO29_13245 [Marmoricola sp.]|nr:hypothetical protein [Marmoricola sp.]